MRRRGGDWFAASPGWGLVDARTGRTVDPPALVSDEKIEMTPWDLQSFAVQVVRDPLVGAGRELMSWSDNPDVSPSLWFVGDSGPEWVEVAAARCTAVEALPPRQVSRCPPRLHRAGVQGPLRLRGLRRQSAGNVCRR